MQAATAYLITGSNLGDKALNLATALEKINRHAGTVHAASAIYKTAPWGITEQPAFLNQAIALTTTLSPQRLLQILLAIENEMGRVRLQKYGTRIIDIDILFYNHLIIQTQELTLPHPHIANRKFVLMPLAEIAADFIHPVYNKTIAAMLQETPDDSEVNKL